MNIIAADVGGTKTWFVVADTGKPGDVVYEAKYNSRDFSAFEPLLQTLIEDSGCDNKQLAAMTLALPGVVRDDVARLTNLPWQISKQSLQSAFGIERVHFMNDFQASALGTAQLQAQDRLTLNPGAEHDDGGIRVAVGAGTGLGVSWMQGSGAAATAWPTEGGHIDFAAQGEEQAELLGFLARRHGHVSYERLLSGDGLVALYEFCSGHHGGEVDGAGVHAAAESGEADAIRAMTLFVRIYGAFVGNLALIFRPEGGIYITGGIAAKIIPWMQSDDFITSYLNKGRMRTVAEQTSVHLVTNERVGVLGAISEAVKQAGTYQ